MPVIVIESDGDYTAKMAENKGKYVLVDFTASWCGPCRFIAPTFEELSGQNNGIVFFKVDVDVCQDAASDVNAMPTFRLYKDGEVVDEFTGASEDNLRALVTKYSS